MADEHWAEVWKVFNSAYDKAPGQRSALLNSESLHHDVRSEVLSLLEVASFCTTRPFSPMAVPASIPEYSVGHEIGRYMILGLIGQGGFGHIYAAHDRDLRRVVALKILGTPLTTDRDSRMDEARAASALNHPNIVTVHETILAGDQPAIVMEFVDGQSLRQLLRETAEPMPVEKIVRYGRQMAEGLSAAHTAGVTHGDVKPENILVRKDEYVKLVDFGLATSVASASPQARQLSGTLRYLSPEQLRGEPSTAASDVFSLGLVMYEMTTGAHAFPGKSALETASLIASVEPEHPSGKVAGIPRELGDLLSKMLAKNSAARPSAAEVERALERIAGPADGGIKRQAKARWAALAVVVALGVLGLAIWQFVRAPAPPLALRLQTKHLSGEEGRETDPALSPDGRFVVYRWQPAADAEPVTLVREVGSEQTTALPIGRPFNWLPDSERIGFLRRRDGRNEVNLSVINKDGSGERTIFRAPDIQALEWSPDGERIVYAASLNKGPASLFAYSIKSGKTQQVTFPPASAVGDFDFAVSPDGNDVAFRRSTDFGSSDLYLASLSDPGAAPRQITSQRMTGADLAWVADGKALVTSWLSGSSLSLWLHPIRSTQPPTRLTEVGQEVNDVRSGFRRKRLVWVSALDDANIWSVPADGSGTPRRIVSSAIRDLDVAVSSQGLLAFRSDRTGAPEIWISTLEGGSQKRVTNMNGRAGSPRWSPDGRRLVFDARPSGSAGDLFVMDCKPEQMTCAAPIALTRHASTDAIPGWSADGSNIYFASQRSGQWQVWKVAADGKDVDTPTQMTTKGGFHAMESADGRWLYYSRIDGDKVMGVWRRPAAGPQSLPDEQGEMVLPLKQWALATWVLSGDEIIYSTLKTQETPAAVWAFHLRTRRSRMIHTTGDVPLARGLAVAPGGETIFFSQVDRRQSNIVVGDYEIVK